MSWKGHVQDVMGAKKKDLLIWSIGDDFLKAWLFELPSLKG